MYTDEQILAVIDCVDACGHRDLSMLLRVMIVDVISFQALSVLTWECVECVDDGGVALHYSPECFLLMNGSENEELIEFFRLIPHSYDCRSGERLGGGLKSDFVFSDKDGKPYTYLRARQLICSSFEKKKSKYSVLSDVGQMSSFFSCVHMRVMDSWARRIAEDVLHPEVVRSLERLKGHDRHVWLSHNGALCVNAFAESLLRFRA